MCIVPKSTKFQSCFAPKLAVMIFVQTNDVDLLISLFIVVIVIAIGDMFKQVE